MTNEQAIKDIHYATNLAKAGQQAPLVGGPIGLMWGVLLSVTLLSHWGIVTGKLRLETYYLGYLWVGFAVIGSIFSPFLGARMKKKTAISSTANQIEQAVWILFAIMLGCFWVGISLSMLIGVGTPALFDFVPVAGFGGQGLAYGVTARMSHNKWLYWPSAAAFIASIVCLTAFSQPHFYLIASVATILTVVLPSLKTIELEHVD
jgi:hypothetical protein